VASRSELARCQALSDECCAKLGIDAVPVEWSGRLKTSVATACRFPRRVTKLNASLWAQAPREEQDETVAHEAAHHGSKGEHGASWRAAMAKLGYDDPSPCHDLDLSQVVVRTSYALICTGCKRHATAAHSKASYRRLVKQEYATDDGPHAGCSDGPGELRWSTFQTMGDGLLGAILPVTQPSTT